MSRRQRQKPDGNAAGRFAVALIAGLPTPGKKNNGQPQGISVPLMYQAGAVTPQGLAGRWPPVSFTQRRICVPTATSSPFWLTARASERVSRLIVSIETMV